MFQKQCPCEGGGVVVVTVCGDNVRCMPGYRGSVCNKSGDAPSFAIECVQIGYGRDGDLIDS